ncbi:MAG: hypothetical protein ACM3PV_15085 [Betaproteobacteria bacterium]
MRHLRTVAPLLAFAAAALVAAALAMAAPGYTVTYRSAANAYLDAGRAQGLAVGDRLRVMEGQKTIAELQVVYVAERSASCKILSETRPVRVGDVVALVLRPSGAAPAGEGQPAAPTPPAAGTAAPPAAAPSSASGAPPHGARWARVRGAASLGYYRSWDRTESAFDFSERTARLDLGLYDVAGQPLSFTLRLRSRQDNRARTLSQRTPQSERSDRLYEAALRYEPRSDRFAFEFGRIGIYRFVGIGYLDGGLARYRLADNVQLGAFGGRMADFETIGFGGTGQKYGGFVRLAPGGRHAMGGFDATLAFVRENADGDVSREYLSLESRLGRGSRFWLFERAELDLNRGWRQEVTGKSYQLSNVSLSANLRLSASDSAFASYDGRRNYRYYQNRLVPEEVFDDLLHQGLRAGLNHSKPGGFGASAGFGMSLKESDPRHPELSLANAYSFNASLRHANFLSSGFSVRLDGSGFSNGYTNGGLVTASLGRRLKDGHMLDLSYGRSFYSVKQADAAGASTPAQQRTTQWLRLLGRAELGHRVYLQGDLEYDTGDDLEGPRGFLELGYLF